MTEARSSAMPEAAGHGAPANAGMLDAVAQMFDLGPEDIGALAGALDALLAEAGLDSRSLLEKLQQGSCLGQALGLPAETGELLYAKAYGWLAVDRPDRAEPLFRALCMFDGRVADYWVGLGVCCRLRSALPEAEIAFLSAEAARADWPVPAFHLAEIALLRNDRAAARGHLERFDTAEEAVPDEMRQAAGRLKYALDASPPNGPTGRR